MLVQRLETSLKAKYVIAFESNKCLKCCLGTNCLEHSVLLHPNNLLGKFPQSLSSVCSYTLPILSLQNL